MYVWYLSVYLNGEAAIAVKTRWGRYAIALESPGTPRERSAIALKTPWSRNANALESPWTPHKRCVIAVQSSCNRHERRVNAVQSPCNRCRSPWRSHGDLTTGSLRCHDVLGDCTALSRRLHGVPTAFFKGRRSHGVCNLQQNTNAVPRRSRRCHGVSWRCHGDAGVLHGDLVTIQIAVRTPP
jgi:hypothetical protein